MVGVVDKGLLCRLFLCALLWLVFCNMPFGWVVLCSVG